MAHWILKHEGLFLGSSSALNLVAAVREAKGLKEGSVVVRFIFSMTDQLSELL